MKAIRVNYIIILVILAMIALLFIQFVQSAQIYYRKSNEFNKRFSTTLESIAIHHEKTEDIRKFMQLANKDFSGQYKDILKAEFQNLLSAKESISIQDTSIFEDGELQNYLIIKGKTYDSISGLTAEQRVLARDVRQLRDLFHNNDKKVSQDSLKLAVQLDQRVIQQIFKKARFVNEMMIEAFRNNVYEDPSKRINITILDSIINHEIKGDELPDDFEFVITDEFDKPLEFENPPAHYGTIVDSSITHKTLLFPSNPLDEDLYLHMRFPSQHYFLLNQMGVPLAINLTLILIIVWAMTFMFKTILTQKKFSELKNDFINNMTHEFRTPISTISLACEAMNDTDMVGKESSTVQPYVKMITEENKRLSLLVERILQSGSLDKGDLKMHEETVMLNEIIHNVVQSAELRISSAGGKINMDLCSELIEIKGDRMHITNAISNLLDNAIKYSNGAPDIKISLKKEGRKIYLSVIDSGIGIKKEHIDKIFDKLYRIPTGNVHNVKGFGLGLSYVKAIAELHNWNITVKSKPEVGSEFTIIIKE